jgi:hypothetical protein
LDSYKLSHAVCKHYLSIEVVNIISQKASPILTPKNSVSFLEFFNISRMRHVFTISSCGKGGFAISGDFKVKKGALSSLRRNPDNVHGKFLALAMSKK